MPRAVDDLLQANGMMMRTSTAADVTLIPAPVDQGRKGECDPEMKQTRRDNYWYFGVKTHTGVDACSGLMQRVVGTAAKSTA